MKRRVVRILTAFSGLILLGAHVPPLGAAAPLAIKVSPTVSFAPAQFFVQAHVQIDRENRALEIVADSPDYYRSSTIQLNGQEAPLTTLVELRNVPRGEYEVTARLYGLSGRPRAEVHQHIAVLGQPSDALIRRH